ncbi:MAG TPA: glycosyltransferase family 2 protein [Candidatus Didemnitutus sp.]|nr:glycosyltransferase family 2 protein [Candidatus Didemnitutus sp.]
MEASFVIPLFNCVDLTRECLRTLQATLPTGFAHEIILVDDGSTDDTRRWLATLSPPCRVLLNERNLGFGAACNRGAAAATGHLLFFLNSDLVFPPGWFEPLCAALVTRPEAGLVGNVQLRADDGSVDHAGLRFNHQGKPVHETSMPDGPAVREVPALTGACFGIRAATWRELGGFDEGFRNGGEDVDLCLRARSRGHPNLIALRSVVKHHISRSPGRKERDEENSRRLALRWRQAIGPLAASDWSRHYLDSVWSQPHDAAGFLEGARAWLHIAGLRTDPGSFARQGAQRAIEIELARWRHLLDGAPADPPPFEPDVL